MKPLHDIWYTLVFEKGNIHGDKFINVIEYDKDDDMFLVEFQEVYSRYEYGKRVERPNTLHTELYARADICTFSKKHMVGWDKAINELLNEKAGIDSVHIEWKNTRHIKYEGRSWWLPNCPEPKRIVELECKPQSIGFQKGNALHHNYKPASIGIRGDTVCNILFAKNGLECIPPEHFYPSNITAADVDQGNKNDFTRVALGTTAISKMLSRVPKTRWDWLDKYRKMLKTNHIGTETFAYDGKVIPVELKPMLVYPLEEDVMFTLMLAC